VWRRNSPEGYRGGVEVETEWGRGIGRPDYYRNEPMAGIGGGHGATLRAVCAFGLDGGGG